MQYIQETRWGLRLEILLNIYMCRTSIFYTSKRKPSSLYFREAANIRKRQMPADSKCSQNAQNALSGDTTPF